MLASFKNKIENFASAIFLHFRKVWTASLIIWTMYFNVHEFCGLFSFCELMYFYFFFSFMRPKNKIRRPAPAPIINNNTAEYRYSQQYNSTNNSTQQYPTEPSSNSTGAINNSSPNFHCYPAAVYTMHGSRLFESILMSSLIWNLKNTNILHCLDPK